MGCVYHSLVFSSGNADGTPVRRNWDSDPPAHRAVFVCRPGQASQTSPQEASCSWAEWLWPPQIVRGLPLFPASMTSSRWLHSATKRSKYSLLPSPPFSISACMVPDLLKVLRHRMISAR